MKSNSETASARLIANQRNSLASTGPVSRLGKMRVRRNALKHGLAAGPLARKFSKRQIHRIVQELVGSPSEPATRHAAEEFAVAHLYWLRVLNIRKKIARQKLSDLESAKGLQKPTAEALLIVDPELKKLDRYERRAFRRRLHAARFLSSLG